MKWLTPLITALGFAVVVFVLVDRLPPRPSAQERLDRRAYIMDRIVTSREETDRTAHIEFDELVRQQTRDAIDYAKDHPASRP